MVSQQMPKRKKKAVTSEVPTVQGASSVQDHGHDEGEERNRAGETSGRKAETDCPSRDATSRAARDSDEVDELFSKLRKKIKAIKAQPTKQVSESKQAARKKRKVVGDKDDIFGEGSARLYRVGADGLKVFTEEELKVGQGGNTDLCPFDCQCCF